MRPSHRPADDPTLREEAGRLYQEHFDRWILESVGGQPPPGRAEHGAVASFLAELGHLYGVRRWTVESFERAFVHGAIAGWKPGTITRRVAGGFHILSPTCPMGAATEVDASICRGCRSFQEAVTRAALAERARFVTFTELIADGDAVCEALVRIQETPRIQRGG